MKKSLALLATVAILSLSPVLAQAGEHGKEAAPAAAATTEAAPTTTAAVDAAAPAVVHPEGYDAALKTCEEQTAAAPAKEGADAEAKTEEHTAAVKACVEAQGFAFIEEAPIAPTEATTEPASGSMTDTKTETKAAE